MGMVESEQVMKLSCQDCGWSSECSPGFATDEAARHIHDWDHGQDSYPHSGHVVIGTVVIVFRDNG